ncbi:hypothetical protein WK52_00215 [Burkholderia multivorans]|nr:hypothetical protein WK52_00215 [Burkholderia multivorans]
MPASDEMRPTMKYVAVWILGVILLAVLPIGFGDTVFSRYVAGVCVLTVAVAVWAVLGSKGRSEPS